MLRNTSVAQRVKHLHVSAIFVEGSMRCKLTAISPSLLIHEGWLSLSGSKALLGTPEDSAWYSPVLCRRM